MGKYKNGILGPFSGKVGTVIGSFCNGKYVMRAIAAYIKSNPSASQQDVRLKFALMSRLLPGLKEVIEVGFQTFHKGEVPMNAAMSYNLKNAVTGLSPNFTVDFPALRFSQGPLGVAYDPSVTAGPGTVLELEWKAPVWQVGAGATDQLTVVVYSISKGVFVAAQGVAARSALTYELQLPLDFTGDQVHVWYSFVSADGKVVSNSTYVGSVPVL